jgi:hypothetical protein
MLIWSRFRFILGTSPSFRNTVGGRQVRSSTAALAMSGLLFAAPAAAQEEDVQQCAAAYEQAQVFRNAGQLAKAQDQLRVCVRDVCPDFVKVDCGQWLSDVKREMPSVVFVADDGSGRELSDVRVSVDGIVIQESLDGKALELDPGQHEVQFVHQDRTLKQKLIVRQGEKNRVVQVEFTSAVDTDHDGVLDAADACPAEAGTAGNRGCAALAAVEPVAKTKSIDPRIIGAISAWGVGALGFVGFAAWGSKGAQIGKQGAKECNSAGGCTPDELARVRARELNYIVPANISVTVGGVGAATGVVLLILSQVDPRPAAATSAVTGSKLSHLSFSATPTSHGASVNVSGRF